MKKIKDLIYDYNDVFVALLIVVVAAGVLAWRINVVMGYPFRSAKVNPGQQIDINFDDVDLNKEDVDPIVNPDDEVPHDGPVIVPPVDNPPVDNPPVDNPPVDNPPVDNPPVDNPPTPQVKTYTLKISKDNKNTNWTAVGNELKRNGIIGEDDNLGKKANELKLDGSLQLGTFELNSGMTLEEIVKIVTR